MRNGKRTLSLLLLALLVALLLPGAAHADPPKGDTHLHSWSVTSEKKATCTEAGSKTWKCSLCGQTYTETYPALGHSFDSGKITTQPTCTEYGVRTYTCSRCGEKKTSAIRPTGHTPAILPAEDPTCVDPGLTEGTVCKICNEILTPQEAIPATGHSWSDWALLTEATCTEGGTEIRSCLSCGAEETRSTDALGHAPVTIPGSDPTCEADGYTDGETCDRCGFVLKERQVLPAIGHEWDEGAVTTEPSGFTPGVRTFTCKNDPGHTRTEEIDPAPWLFATFTGSFPDFTTFDLATKDLTPLTITEQPVGGSITRYSDETVPLHVAATGGVGEYTYQWYSQRLVSFHTFGLSSYNWPSAVGDNSPDYAADIGLKKYFCVVTDEAGNTAASEYANVEYKLSIAKQPDNANLQPTGKATLTCEAIDGSGSYSYRWIDNQDHEIDVGSSIDVTEIGDYMCIATDDLTGETASSYMATVYDTEPFTLVYLTGDGEYNPEGSGILVSEFKGGVTPYEFWWDKDGEAIESYDGEVNENYGSVVYNATVGNYTVHAVDAMGAVVTATSHRTAPKLTIVQQPEDGVIIKGTHGQISVAVSDGDAPYTFTLFRNGKHLVQATENSKTSTFAVWYPGEYLFLISDARGRSAKSDPACFEDSVFRITSQTETSSITRLYGSASMSVTAEGGKEPYTYTWTYQNGGSWFKVGENADVISVYKPGVYSCTVKDSANQSIKSKQITVTYTGKVPMIVEQPTSRRELSKDVRWIDLKCKAISGTGDDSNLRYDWYTRKSGGGWTIYAADIQSYPGYFAGEYRCKVTDTATGGYTWSEVALAYEELVCKGIAIVSKGDNKTSFTLSCKGGTAPYDVTIYMKYPYWTGTTTEYKDVEYAHFTCNSFEELGWISLDNHVKLVGTTSDGKTTFYMDVARYYAVIVDANGNKCTSSTFAYK